MPRSLLEYFQKTIDYLENVQLPFSSILLTFFFEVSLRNFIESFSDHGEITFGSLFHFYNAYLALALTLILLFHLATKTPVIKIAKVIFPSFLVLIIAPLLDLVISRGAGFDMNYMHPGLHDDLLFRFFTFFGPLEPMAVTPGIRIEIALVLIASFIYFYIKTARWPRSLFFTFLMYCVFFIYGAFPFVLKGLKLLTGVPFWPTDLVLAFSAITISLFMGLAVVYLANPNLFKRIVKDICPYRVAHYELMILLGIIIGLNTTAFSLTHRNIFYFLFLPVAGFFAGMYSLIGNNLSDVDIDRISNRSRSLVSAQIALENYKKLQVPFALLALFLSVIINFKILFLVLLFMGNYYLYSMPPLRLKRVTYFSKLTISLNSLVMVMAGYLLIAGSLQKFPLLISLFFLLVLTAPINFIDLKDFEGDKRAGIKTLPVVLGLENSKKVIGIFFILSYFIVGFLLRNAALIVPLLFLGILQFYWVTREDYREDRVFITYLASLIGFIFYLATIGLPI